MRISCCQPNIAWEDKQANFQKVRALLAKANLPAGGLFVLPEMFATGFSMNVQATQEGDGSMTEAFLAEIAAENGLCVVGGLAGTNADGRPANQLVVLSPQRQLLARYTKIQPFTLGGEAQQYAAGTELAQFKWQGGAIAPFICYDLRFPELFRSAVRQGAQVFVVIANWPIKRDAHWVALLQARAIENQAYVVGVNRSGTDPKFIYSGRSMVVDPHGKIILDLGSEEGIGSIDIDVALVDGWRKDFPALQDMHWGLHG
jgi:predicted amidohydrolase